MAKVLKGKFLSIKRDISSCKKDISSWKNKLSLCKDKAKKLTVELQEWEISLPLRRAGTSINLDDAIRNINELEGKLYGIIYDLGNVYNKLDGIENITVRLPPKIGRPPVERDEYQ